MPEERDSPGHAFTVTCFGAAHSVTGSMHLVEVAGRRVLLDCGLVRGPHTPVLTDGRHFPFEPPSIDAVILSHAHIDHCGNLPRLIRQGYRGPIYCTPGTRDLAVLMLADSARIQEEETHVMRVIGVPGGRELQPAYTREDVARADERYVAVPYGHEREVVPDVWLRFANAGHILGSAMVHLRTNRNGQDRSLTFTGDLGRPGLPLLQGPDPVPPADLVLSESTNGGRRLPPLAEAVERLEELVRQTAERGGKVVIPAFSTGRIQVLLHYLLDARCTGRIPDLPICVDSPLAADITAVYRGHTDLQQSAPDGVEFIRTLEASRELSQRRESCIVLAPGGMCDGTRIQNHLRQNVDDPRCTVVLVSYQAPHSAGRRLLTPGPTVRLQGKKWNRWADIVELAGFSGHPDGEELLRLLTPLAGRTRKLRLIHGEPENAENLAAALRERGFHDVAVPAAGEPMSVE